MIAPRRDGFTLLEILVVIVITAVLVGAAVTAFRDVNRHTRGIGAGLERERAVKTFLDRLERELSSTMMWKRQEDTNPLEHPWLFAGFDGYEAETDTDAIKFITYAPSRAAGNSYDTGIRMVSYGVREDEEGRLVLHRFEEPVPRGASKAIQVENGSPVLEDIELFDLAFHDPKSGVWLQSWDSTQIQQLDRVPAEVRATITVWQEDADGNPVLGPENSRTVRLWTPTLDLQALRDELSGGVDPNSELQDPNADCVVTVAECVDAFAAELAQSGANMQALVDEEAAVRGDHCFNPEGPLADLLRELGDPDAECQ